MDGRNRAVRRRSAGGGVAAACLAAALLAGCSASKQVDSTCPKILPAPGADKIAVFAPGDGRALKDVMVGGTIIATDVQCLREKTGLAVNASIQFFAERANLQIKDATLPYFVALVDSEDHVLTEEAYQIKVAFLPAELSRRLLPQKITVHLPVRDRAMGGAYSVIVGFQLSPDQIAFNRADHPSSPSGRR